MKKMVVLTLCLIPIVGLANTAIEKQELTRVKNVLESTKPLINAAKKARQANARVQFRYGWLRKDINSIIAGINQKLNAIRIEPRSVKPLKGDYLTMRSAK